MKKRWRGREKKRGGGERLGLRGEKMEKGKIKAQQEREREREQIQEGNGHRRVGGAKMMKGTTDEKRGREKKTTEESGIPHHPPFKTESMVHNRLCMRQIVRRALIKESIMEMCESLSTVQ